jgi:23S rRNA (uracil1939-C5)-methyltransferase
VLTGESVPPWAYRTSMRLATTTDGSLGLRARGSHDVVDLDGCLIAHPLLEDLLLRVKSRGTGEVALRVAAATGERSAWVADGPVQLIDVPDDARVGSTAAVHEHVSGHSFRISAPSFFQSGPAAAELLVASVAQACEGAERSVVVDAYGGVGLFARTVAADRVIVVESSESACADAVVNLAGLDTAVVCTTVEEWSPVPADLVIADPSRQGLGRTGVDVLAATTAATIVLVSCDPVAMARDSALLRDRGYDHVTSTVLDLFPQTPHVEVVTTFARR